MSQWCDNCGKYGPTGSADGRISCIQCGKVLSEDNFTEEVQFVKTANGQSRMAGNFVRSVRNTYSESTERTLDDAYFGIKSIMSALEIDGGDEIANGASNLYRLLLERNVTRGRRKDQVLAACLYIMCRVKSKPYLLIDFSEHLRINVYVLGAVFLQLCKILSLEETHLFQKLVDPSLFIHRFADRLLRSRNINDFDAPLNIRNVSRTALQIIASMKRDWMQTGRKPSGLCGAALYISALAHGCNFSKSEIIKVVHICEATLTTRLIEFENTESGGLTMEEFEKKSEEFNDLANKFGEDEMKSINTGEKTSRSGELLCKHEGAEFAHGLCNNCYKDFMILSGGLNGGSEPPAFQRAERKRVMAMEADANIPDPENLHSSMLPCRTKTNSKLLNSGEQQSIKNTVQKNVKQPADPESTGDTLPLNTNSDTINDRTDASDFTFEESESLSDIDDSEVDVYINTEEEKNLKTTVWEEINREYLEEQAAKEAAALAAKKAYEASFSKCSGDVGSARHLAAAAAAVAAQNRKEKRQKRAAELKSLGPPSTTGEAVEQMLDKKTWSSKIRYDGLKDLFDSDEPIPKKSKAEAKAGTDAEAEAEQEREGEEDYLDSDEDPELELDGIGDEYTEEYDYEQDYNGIDEF